MKASDNPYPSLLITEGTEPSAPAAGKQRIYIDSTTHLLKRTDSGGVDVTIEHGAWQTYTPAWTSDGTAPAIGNGTLSGRYRLLDASSMQIIIQFVRGSTSTNGTGNYQFSMPSGYKAGTMNQVISARLLDSGTAHYSATGYIDAGTTAFFAIVADASGTRIFAHTQPITLATSDELNLSGILEYALV